ncbi:hypothetical protein QTI66_23725 [Variovorax sp. J22R133]|uniref:hypothetical protein n=1 Tax=Variovorax brevis TaxID=3053503 RepID=UPI002578F536|nr:hypothetical protein [Variovorax sp. J22R133]MDM0115180.1 hypothetical protein [Variovorax sp. J22R133]
MTTQTPLVSGLGGAIGCSFRSPQNQLVFVEYAGKLSRLNLLPSATIVSQGTTVLKGTFTFDLDTGVQGGTGSAYDIWWEQMTTTARQMAVRNTARIVNLGVVSFTGVTASALQTLTYGTAPIPGNNDATNKLVNGDVFCVRTSLGNFAKVKVVSYGYDMTIQWITYKPSPAYAVIGTGYTNPEDVKVSIDNLHAYVTERTGTLLRVTLTSANRASATVVTTGMSAPQQIFLDEAHGVAYVIEYASPGHLWRVNLGTGARTAVVSNLENGVGVVLSADLQFAYVSEQTAGPDQGRVSRIQISDGATTKIATGLVAPFHLTWSDASQNTLLVAERDPANRITSIGVNGGTALVVGGVPARPSSVAMISSSRMLVCSDQVVEKVDFVLFQPAGPLLMGIGFIPFDKVQASGLATTDPGYFYPVTNVPFGGTLPLMINFQRAANNGAKFYRVRIDGVLRADTWTDYKWNGTTYVLQTIGPVSVGGNPNFYPVHPIAELFLWMNPSLGMLADSTTLSNGLHTITIDFTTSAGAVIESSTPLTIMVNNQSCTASLSAPTIGGVGADNVCGLLHYGVASNPNPVTMALSATHPANYANWSFSLIKGVNQVLSTGGAVPAPAAPVTAPVATLLGACTVAGFAEYLYVATTINNGWGRQGQYDASAALAFVLAA